MPWLPLPELLITGIIAPAMRASQAAEVQDSIRVKMLSPITFRSRSQHSVRPTQ